MISYIFGRSLILKGVSSRNFFKLSRGTYPVKYARLAFPIKISSLVCNLRFKHNFTNSSDQNNESFSEKRQLVLAAFILSSGIALWFLKDKKLFAEQQRDTAGAEIPGLPEYSAEEISKHDSLKNRVWVCFKSGVYDITDFIPKHPGGEKILMAAGASLEPFWEIFAVHKSEQVMKMLEEHRIGNLKADDRGLSVDNSNDPFALEPKRHPALECNSKKPFNAEPPNDLLVENFLTPNELFFVRNHLPVPLVDPEEYELEIEGIGVKGISLNLKDIKTKFKKHHIVAAIQCAGNRRTELSGVKEVKGLSWGNAAISNAEWAGASLYEVLQFAGVDFEDSRIQHIQFEGLDTDPANSPYGASIPAIKALDPKNDILLAYEMNGKELPRDHGFPIRLVAPGIVGARNVKWLGKIIISDEESKSHWQANDYKGFSPSTSWENVDFSSAPAIQELPVNSAICKPTDNSSVKLINNCLKVQGYAWSGGGRKIVRVEVSVDRGKTWHPANLQQDNSSLYKCWSWTLWSVNIQVEVKKDTNLEILCKAIDSSYNNQPDSLPPIWNIRGVLNNAWHRINVKVCT